MYIFPRNFSEILIHDVFSYMFYLNFPLYFQIMCVISISFCIVPVKIALKHIILYGKWNIRAQEFSIRDRAHNVLPNE